MDGTPEPLVCGATWGYDNVYRSPFNYDGDQTLAALGEVHKQLQKGGHPQLVAETLAKPTGVWHEVG